MQVVESCVSKNPGRNHLFTKNAKYEGNGGVEKLSALSGINQMDNFSGIGESFTTSLVTTADPVVVKKSLYSVFKCWIK